MAFPLCLRYTDSRKGLSGVSSEETGYFTAPASVYLPWCLYQTIFHSDGSCEPGATVFLCHYEAHKVDENEMK